MFTIGMSPAQPVPAEVRAAAAARRLHTGTAESRRNAANQLAEIAREACQAAAWGRMKAVAEIATPGLRELWERPSDVELLPETYGAAVAAMSYLSPVDSSVGRWLEDTWDLDRKHLSTTRSSLEILSLGPEKTVPLFAKALTDSDPLVRRNAAIYLDALGPAGRTASAALISALGDDTKDVVIRAAYALGAIGPPNDAARAPLKKLLGDDSEFVRLAAAYAIIRLGHASVGVAALEKLLESRHPLYHWQVGLIVWYCGQDAKAIAPALTHRLQNPEILPGDLPGVSMARALAAIDPESGVGLSYLVEFVERWNDPGTVYEFAARALGDLGKLGSPALKRLEAIVANRQVPPQLRRYVAEAVDRIKAGGRPRPVRDNRPQLPKCWHKDHRSGVIKHDCPEKEAGSKPGPTVKRLMLELRSPPPAATRPGT